jgi:SEC-C motif
LLVEEKTPLQVYLNDDCASWPIVVVIDHPQNPTVTLPHYDDAFCITLKDWQEINRHLRSIHQLLRYVRRVLASGTDVSVPLGYESHRFKSLVSYEASQFKTDVTETSFAATRDPGAIAVYRELLEKTWGANDLIPRVPIEDYRPVLDYLDDVPAVVQAYVGRWILSRHEQLNRTGKLSSGSVLLVDRPLVYMCDNTQSWLDKQTWLGNLLGLTALRASEWQTQMSSKQPVLGIGVRILGLSREYSYVLVRGGRMPADLSRIIEWKFGVANFHVFKTRSLRIGRNERCPCGGGRKYKYCHGRNEN